jgi:Dyp-type peroxidase family
MGGVGLDLDDIQGGIVPGFRSDFQDLLFVRFPSQAAGRAWLGLLYEEVSSAREIATFGETRQLIRHPRPLPTLPDGTTPPQRDDRNVELFLRTTWVNVALSAAGLEIILGQPAFAAAGFPSSFTDGMTNAGLDYPAEIDGWHVRDRAGPKGKHSDRVAHAVLILGTDTAADLDRERDRQLARLREHKLTLAAPPIRGTTLGGGREHFGFADGITRPDPTASELLAGTWNTSATVVAPGEFIVGAKDEEASTRIDGPDWARNGSYLAFRQLRQHVGRFRDALDAGAAALAADVHGATGAFVGAKLFGRWRSGAKVIPPASGAGPELADPFAGATPPQSRLDIVAEDYAHDQHGDGCPLFSHARRAHPRNSPNLRPRRHQILRRGIAYGEPLGENEADTGDRGLLFMAYQASLANGFEHIQRAWFNDSETPEKPGGAGSHGWDPIVGNVPGGNPAAARVVEYHLRGPSQPAFDTVSLTIQRFVEVTAGGYFFTPSISALWSLS